MKSNDEIMNLLNQLKVEKKLSISEIARRVGMAKSAVSRYFNKSREFPLYIVSDFVNAFGVSPVFILGITVSENGILNDIYNQLNEHRQKKVYKFVKNQLEEQHSINQKDDTLIAAHIDDDLTEEQESEVQAYIVRIRKRHSK